MWMGIIQKQQAAREKDEHFSHLRWIFFFAFSCLFFHFQTTDVHTNVFSFLQARTQATHASYSTTCMEFIMW